MDMQVNKIVKKVKRDAKDQETEYAIELENKTKSGNFMTMRIKEFVSEEDDKCSFSIGDVWHLKKTHTQEKIVK